MSIENVYDLNRYIQMQYTNTINILFALSRLYVSSCYPYLDLSCSSQNILSCCNVCIQCFIISNRLNTVKLLDYYLGLKTLNLKILKRYML